MQEDIKLEISVDDSGLVQALNNHAKKIGDVQDAFDEVGDEGTRAIGQLSNAVAAGAKTIDGYKKKVQENEAAIDRLKDVIVFKERALLNLEKRYKSFGKTSSAEAKKVKRAMDQVRLSIKDARVETRELSQQNIFNKAQIKNLEQTGGRIRLASHEMQNLRFQVTDFAVQVGSGQGIFRPLLQQGPQLVEAIGGPRRALRFFSQQAGLALKSVLTLRGGFMLLIASTVGLIALPLLIFLSKSKKATDALADTFAYLSGFTNQLINNFFTLGETLIGFVKGEKTFKDLTSSVTGLGDGLAEAGQEARGLAQDLRAIEQIEKSLEVARAQNEKRLVELRAIAEDETRSLSERADAQRQLTQERTQSLQQDLTIAKQRLEIANAEAARTAQQREDAKGIVADTDEQREALIKVAEIEAKLLEQNFSAQAAERSFRKQRQEAYRERQQQLQDLRDKAQEVRDMIQGLEDAELRGIDKVRAERAAAIVEIDRQEAALRKLYRERGVEFDLEEEFAQARVLVNRKATKEIEGLLTQERLTREKEAAERLRAEDELAAARIEKEIEALDTREELLLGRVALMERRRGQTETEFLIETERRKLNIQIAALQQRAKLLSQQYGPSSPEVQLVRQQIQLLQKEYDRAADITVSPFLQLKQKVLDSLNITEEEASQILASAGDAISAIGDALNAGLELQIAQQEAVIKRSEKRIKDLQSELDAALEDQAAGYANDAALLQQKLDLEQEALTAAEERRAALQEKSTKRQARQNQIQAASEYALMVIRLLSSETATKGVVGIGIALGGIALIAKIIAEQKRAAAELVAPGFKDGTPFLEGPGDGRSDSIPAFLSRGERVVSARDNAEIGGRALSPEELVHYVKLGKAIEASPGSFAPALSEGQQAQQRAMDALQAREFSALRSAYAIASERAAAQIVEAVKSQPLVIPVGNSTRVRTGKNKWKVYTQKE